MEVVFATRKMQKSCSEKKKMVQELGSDCAAKLQQRLSELAAVETLEDMRTLPGARCHELTADRQGQLAVSLKQPYRLIFVPDYDTPPLTAEGGLDWRGVKRIRIVEIVDYH